MSDKHEHQATADVIELGKNYKGKRSRSNGDQVVDDETSDASVIPFDDVVDVIARPITGSDSSGESDETAPPGRWLVHVPAAPYLNAELFTKAKHRHEVRDLLIHHGGTFERWNATCWPALEDRALRSSVYRFFADGYYGIPPVLMAPFHPTTRKVADIIDALKAHVHISQHLTAPAWLDGNGPRPADELISLANGLLHIPTRSLVDHTPNFYVSWSLPYDFDSSAPAPKRWLRFLDEVWGDDDESKAALQEWFGYFLSGSTNQQKMLMLVGPRRSGKGTIALGTRRSARLAQRRRTDTLVAEHELRFGAADRQATRDHRRRPIAVRRLDHRRTAVVDLRRRPADDRQEIRRALDRQTPDKIPLGLQRDPADA